MELSDFSRNAKTKVQENERKSFKGSTILFDLPIYSRYWDSRCREFFCLKWKKCVMSKEPKNLFELSKSSTNWVFEFSRVNCISGVHISESKRCYNVVIHLVHYFYAKAEMLTDFQICISVPWIKTSSCWMYFEEKGVIMQN